MAENSAAAFHRVAILGTGLIGGSFALALRPHLPAARIIGFDREPILQQARARNAIDESSTDLATAVRGADLIYIALPISATIELLPEIARHAAPHALVTDAGSTKRAICRAAAQHFHTGAIFLGGHPMAGKETEGIAAADASLFQNAKYALIDDSGESKRESKTDPRVAAFVALLEKMRAQTGCGSTPKLTTGPSVAIISHLPQMAAVALAEVIAAESDGEASGLPTSLAGPGVRDSLLPRRQPLCNVARHRLHQFR